MEKSTEILLSKLADKLGTTTDKVYQVTIKQAKIEFIGNVVFGLVWVVMAIMAIVLTTKIDIKDLKDATITLWIIPDCFLLIADLYFILSFLIGSVDYFKNLFTLSKNPEYWAIQDIFSSVISD